MTLGDAERGRGGGAHQARWPEFGEFRARLPAGMADLPAADWGHLQATGAWRRRGCGLRAS